MTSKKEFQFLIKAADELYSEDYEKYNAIIKTARRYPCLETDERIEKARIELANLFNLSQVLRLNNNQNRKEEA